MKLFSRLWLLLLAVTATAVHAQDRIVTLGSDVTEIVFALGQGDRIIAVDDTSMYPAQTAKLPKLGYLRQLAPEPILATRPTLILASRGAGPEAVLRQVERAGVKLVAVPDEPSAAGIAAKIRTVAAALGLPKEGEKLAAATISRLPKTQPEAGPRMILVLANAPGRILAAGTGTAGDALIRLSGGRNAFVADGYKPLSPEAALAANPDVILVPSHVVGMLGGLDAIRNDPALVRTSAVQKNRVFVVDSLAGLNFGPRLPDAIARLNSQIAAR
ncbi:heme/hemin ABC transporter substrate-binding protein [Sandaracinobacteroides hominis]|uniref:heme/hemin ABC transporter substrate-binding protein n=1 Tax=Sandaracinobacteroides hominis TaxID=2780086 RepID=UPI0018F42450|nr:ABC transporter substrate-binding protein [Sandaracinobacteroides hominis]